MDFICGNSFKNLCDFSFDEEGFKRNSKKNKFFDEPLVFIKTDYVFHVINDVIKEPVRIITHNSDLCIDQKFKSLLDSENVIHWFAQNISLEHSKLSSIPIGMANSKWAHGDKEALQNCINKNNKKTNTVYANFTVNTNPRERSLCLNSVKRNGIDFVSNLPFDKYLQELSKSMFSISPNGNGIDCHKTWESLYLKTIPIVTKSINSLRYSDLPILIIDNWDDLDNIVLNKDLYSSVIGGFDISDLNIKNFLI
jgi:hypothetical protein